MVFSLTQPVIGHERISNANNATFTVVNGKRKKGAFVVDLNATWETNQSRNLEEKKSN